MRATWTSNQSQFDAAISRLALMLLPERAKVMAQIYRALKPGGQFAAIVLSSAEENPYTRDPIIAGRYAGLPSSSLGDPGFFSLGDPAVLESTFESAGFRNVRVEASPTLRRFPSLDAAVQDRRDSLPELDELLQPLTNAQRGRKSPPPYRDSRLLTVLWCMGES
jgi:SAM-dependent methyltransferase